MILLGITGTIGAGKGTVVDYLVKEKGFAHYSARNFIVEEIVRRHLPVNRDSMTDVSNDLRATHGPAYIIEQLYRHAQDGGKNAIIESVREVAGAEFIKERGGFILAVDADRPVRYERITSRGSETDRVTFEEFVQQEEREMASGDPNKQNLLAVIEMADFYILNNGTLAQLHERVDDIVTSLINQ